jgi:CheY-like chemotaxis protein
VELRLGDDPRQPPLRGIRILLLEDDPDTLETMAVYLRQQGASVMAAHTGQEAVEAYAEEHPDVMISDIVLPEVDGHAVVRYLRRMGMTAPAIAISAISTPEARFRSAQVGFDLHLTKPVAPDLLLSAVMELATDRA